MQKQTLDSTEPAHATQDAAQARESAQKHLFDTIVVGAGPAGCTAALCAARAGLSTLLLEKLAAGGQMATVPAIENYPAFFEDIDGMTLGQRMQKSVERFGARFILAQAMQLDTQTENGKKRLLTNVGTFHARTVILATGARMRQLGIAREQELIGRGVSYCAACDGALYRGKDVAVVGGGDSAAGDALYLSKLCKKVHVLFSRPNAAHERARLRFFEGM